MRPRVMVSSVITGFEHIREAARRAIEAGGGEPLLVNEDFPALAVSPRNACLNAVDSSDVYLVIVGQRAGYKAPSGKPVVEEEYERAVARGLPIIALIQENVTREPEADRLEKRISDYVQGHFRATFATEDELEASVAAAVRQVPTYLRRPRVDPETINSKIRSKADDQREVLLRTVFAPIRDEDVVDIVELGQEEFRETLIALGMKKDVSLFSAWHGKDLTLRDNRLAIRQDPGGSPPIHYARIEIGLDGVTVIDSNVTGRRDARDRIGMAGMEIVERDVAEALAEHFAFARELYGLVDPYRRQHAFSYNAALLGADYRPLVKEPTTGGSISMSMRANEPVIAHGQPRQVGRAILSDPGDEIERTLELLRRNMSD